MTKQCSLAHMLKLTFTELRTLYNGRHTIRYFAKITFLRIIVLVYKNAFLYINFFFPKAHLHYILQGRLKLMYVGVSAFSFGWLRLLTELK